jgi:hypothetical protein
MRGGTDVAAFMLGARLGREVLTGRGSVTLWYDYLSGNDPDSGETEVFSTLFATNHKFYGLADVFLNIPAHTAGAGLQDMAIKLASDPVGWLNIATDLHSFRVSKQGALSGTHFGEEVDVTLTGRYWSNFTTTAGFSYVFADEPLKETGRLSEDLKWFYLMVRTAF